MVANILPQGTKTKTPEELEEEMYHTLLEKFFQEV